MDFTDFGPAMSMSDIKARLDRVEMSKPLMMINAAKTDLHHISTGQLEALAEKYRRRALVSPNDQGLHLRIQFIMNEIGLRQIVADIEKDLAVK
jgi:hypothetical protein